jgi:DNA polymerase III epsilon subunit-like protein
MAVWISDTVDALWVVYDLEFVSRRAGEFEKCAIWDIGALALAGGVVQSSFSGSCVPCHPIPPPVSSEYAPITKKWLKKQPNYCKSKRICLQRFLQWLLQCRVSYGKSKIILASHGNFRSDKVVLEAECLREGWKLPDCVYFYDTLSMFRRILPGIEHYSLQSISRTLLRSTCPVEHRALADAQLLERCLRVVGAHNLVGCIYRGHKIPLQSLPGIGYYNERNLVLRHGVSGVYDLASRCVALRATERSTCRSLLVHFYGIKWSNAKKITESLLCMFAGVPRGTTGVVR